MSEIKISQNYSEEGPEKPIITSNYEIISSKEGVGKMPSLDFEKNTLPVLKKEAKITAISNPFFNW